MKTSHNATSNQKKNHGFIRLSMMIVGIVTALIISLTLMQTPHLEKNENLNNVVGVSTITTTHFATHMAGKVVASLWPF